MVALREAAVKPDFVESDLEPRKIASDEPRGSNSSPIGYKLVVKVLILAAVLGFATALCFGLASKSNPTTTPTTTPPIKMKM
eukprot:gene21655-28670_t